MPGTGDTITAGPSARSTVEEREQELLILDQKILKSFETLQMKMEAEYGPPLCGRNRAVYIDLDEGVVYKVPRNFDGLSDNSYEAHHTDPGIPLAKCELLQIDDIPVLKMQRVNPYHGPLDQLPDWTGWVDGGQVGHTPDGHLVAYDL